MLAAAGFTATSPLLVYYSRHFIQEQLFVLLTAIAWLEEPPGQRVCRVLSNAKCLTEGVDVPALDAALRDRARSARPAGRRRRAAACSRSRTWVT